MPKERLKKTETAGSFERQIEKSIGAGEVLIESSIKKTTGYWKMLGPGLTTGAADDDPSGIATYSQAGARYGFQLLWLAPLTFPLMALVQEMCARIGIVTGQGLAANIRQHFSKKVLFICAGLLFLANTFNIGADLGAMAQATRLLNPKLGFGLLIFFFTAITLLFEIFMKYERYARYLKYLALILLAYVFSALSIQLDWKMILSSTVIPSINFSKEQILLITGILGTTISPYLFFWQTAQEVEQEIAQGKPKKEMLKIGASPREISKMRLDVWAGMLLSNVVMFFIIAACAATLNANGLIDITSAAQAAAALRPFAGEQAYLLFALGIIGTGLLALPVLAGSASYALSESFGWHTGLNLKLKKAYAFYGVIILSMVIGFVLNFIGLDPIKALIYSAVANGLIAPVVLVLIVLLSSDPKVMGNWRNRKFTTLLGWLVVLLMSVAGIATIISLFT
ncbi:MAG: NRAMP family divalent metal transporter [Acidobacteriaceae bacterium]